jgi:transcriptional regulator with GAF, ATPase, and Fis domain
MPVDGYRWKGGARDAVAPALAGAGGVQAGAAKLLHVSPRVLHYKVHRLGIRVPAGVRVRKWKEAG